MPSHRYKPDLRNHELPELDLTKQSYRSLACVAVTGLDATWLDLPVRNLHCLDITRLHCRAVSEAFAPCVSRPEVVR